MLGTRTRGHTQEMEYGADTSKELKEGSFSVPHIFIFLKNAFDDSMTFGTDTASTYETDINSINAVTNE